MGRVEISESAWIHRRMHLVLQKMFLGIRSAMLSVMEQSDMTNQKWEATGVDFCARSG